MGETKLLFIYVKERDKDCTKIPDLVFAFTFARANQFVTLHGAKMSANNYDKETQRRSLFWSSKFGILIK